MQTNVVYHYSERLNHLSMACAHIALVSCTSNITGIANMKYSNFLEALLA